MIACPECGVHLDDDDIPQPPQQGPGCWFCNGTGLISANRRFGLPPRTIEDVISGRPWATVSDLIGRK